MKKLMVSTGRCMALLLSVFFFPFMTNGWTQANKPLGEFENSELIDKGDRAFSSRNFLAAEKYFRELNQRLLNSLAKLKPSETVEEVEIPEELILAPFGLGHSLLFLHRYEDACTTLESGLRLYPDWATDHLPVDFFSDPDFTGPVLLDLQNRIKSSNNSSACQIYGYIRFFRGDIQEAKSSFSRVTSVDHDNFFANYFLSSIQKLNALRLKPALNNLAKN
jgi:hypothetical protein